MAFSTLIISILIIIPIGISRRVVTYEFYLDEINSSIILHTYGMFLFISVFMVLWCFMVYVIFCILWYLRYFYHFIYGFAHLWFNKYCYIFKKDLSRFSNTKAFVSLVYAANFVRDVFSTGLEIVLNTILIYLLKKYYYDKVRYTGRPDEVFSKTEKTNTIITIVISTLSILMHIVTFLVKPLFLLTFEFIYTF